MTTTTAGDSLPTLDELVARIEAIEARCAADLAARNALEVLFGVELTVPDAGDESEYRS